MKKLTALLLLISITSGCATNPDNLPISPVHSSQYSNYSCEELSAELQTNTVQTMALHSILKDKANNDNMQLSIAILLFWPALFMLEGGDGEEATEYSRLKGNRSALDAVYLSKKCGTTMPTNIRPVIKAVSNTPENYKNHQ